MTGKRIRSLFLGVGLVLLPVQAMADCSAFLAEAEAVSGVVPKLEANGRLRSVLVFSSSSFIAPKQSLIDKARSVAELKAKRAFAGWLSEAVSGGTAVSEMLEMREETNQTGDTTGIATELTKQVETMASNTEATLRGLVKLDECVDTADAVVRVALGWRADLQDAAEQAAGGDIVAPAATTSKVNPADGYRVKSPLKDGF